MFYVYLMYLGLTIEGIYAGKPVASGVRRDRGIGFPSQLYYVVQGKPATPKQFYLHNHWRAQCFHKTTAGEKILGSDNYYVGKERTKTKTYRVQNTCLGSNA